MITTIEFGEVAKECGYFPSALPDLFRYCEPEGYVNAMYEAGTVVVKAWTNPPKMMKICHSSANTRVQLSECLNRAREMVDALLIG